MELPQPPQDVDLRNIIDKLAQFVARNGIEFEQMTKNKQKDNPKFSFLFGGEHFNYYQYKVTTEQAILKQKSKQHSMGVGNLSDVSSLQIPGLSNSSASALDLSAAVSAAQWLSAQQQPTSVSPAPLPVTNVTTASNSTIESLVQQQRVLQEQIHQSEQNLAAQHTVLMQQQQAQIEEALLKAQEVQLDQLGVEAGISFPELDHVLAPIVQSCTKDSISAGKGWILQRATSAAANAAIARFLLAKVISVGKDSGGQLSTTSIFSQRLHVIYLVNDVLHHCVRKNADELKKALESVVVPMFCCTSVGISEDQQAKLNKLLTLWESKSNYLDSTTLEKLKQPTKSWAEYQSGLMQQFSSIIATITTATKTTYDNYQTQHQAFVTHALQQIQTLEQQQQALAAVAAALPTPQVRQPQPDVQSALDSQQIPPQPPSVPLSQPPPHLNNSDFQNSQPLPAINQLALPHPPPSGPPSNFSQPPPGFFPGNFPPGVELPDFSRPPPGFPLPPPSIQPHPPPPPEPVDDLMPSVPYFDLPAGLMVPLIKLDDFEYKPLDPDAIRLPPPAPPSERLLAAVEAFYAPPGHDRPRDSGLSVSRRIVDSDGWEKLGLYEYYRAKNQARKVKEEEIASGKRQRSRSPSPIVRPPSREKSPPPKKRYHSLSPEKDKGREKTRERGMSRSQSRSPTRNSSNDHPGNTSNGRRSPLPVGRRQSRPSYRHSRSRSRSKSRSRSRSRSRSPAKLTIERDRSPTPPSFLGSTYAKTSTERLDESNKGHQMLKKMGWAGAGLGAKEQGIEQPISGGEIRDRTDMYKGVGINLNDPYENFRKNKGQAFISRMKARAEERT